MIVTSQIYELAFPCKSDLEPAPSLNKEQLQAVIDQELSPVLRRNGFRLPLCLILVLFGNIKPNDRGRLGSS